MFAFIATAFFGSFSYGDASPTAHISIIDSDGQVAPTQWRSSSTWIWSQNHLLLQTAIEIPSHIAATLPDLLKDSVRGAEFKGPFKLQSDHQLLILELRGPTELFKLGTQSMRVSVDFDHTNWMRNANCRDSDISLSEIEDGASAAPHAFFISLYCRPARNGTWVEVAASDEVSLSFEPHGQIRFQNSPDGTQFWLPAGPHPRVLSDIIVSGGSGEVSARYELAAEGSGAVERAPIRRAALDAEPILFPVENESVAVSPPRVASVIGRVLGIEAQVIDAHGISNGATGLARAELAVVGRATFFERLQTDLTLPIRRLGAGLDSKGAGTHLGYLNFGYARPKTQNASDVTWTYGAQALILDVRSPNRESVYALSPSVAAHFGALYSITAAPFDFVSNFSFVRARADLPVTKDQKNRLTLEAHVGRTWFQPKNDSWNTNGVSLGFVGEF